MTLLIQMEKFFTQRIRKSCLKSEKLYVSVEKKGLLIIFIQHYHRKYLYDKELLSGRRVNCIEGSGGEELMPELSYQEKTDYIVKKKTI